MADHLKCLSQGIPLKRLSEPKPIRDERVPHAPFRNTGFSRADAKLAVKNALRYFPQEHHAVLASEFAQELQKFGHIYMYRFRPNIEMRAYPISDYPAKTTHGAAIMHMIMNNLDPCVAQFPHELVTYGGNGQVYSNWAQFWLTMKYLAEMDDDQTLVMYSGHPLGLFPSSSSGPRVVITNGMVIPNYSSRAEYDQMFGLGVTIYGQMTAGSYCYIGPQGIVHGTTLTLLNAGRKHVHSQNLRGKVYVTSGLGGMSGAQAKAAVISGCIGVIAEVCPEALQKRLAQGWLQEAFDDLDALVARIRRLRQTGQPSSLGYQGNVVHLWERLVVELETTGECLADLGSDQTSCHNPFNGGYYPVQLSMNEANEIMATDKQKFRKLVQESLCRQVLAINRLASVGKMHFWDYGNAFLLEAHRAGAEVVATPATGTAIAFRYASYVQDIMGDIFSLGFGPFRWVCTSTRAEDLELTDTIASGVLQEIINEGKVTNRNQFLQIVSQAVCSQYRDNIHWIKEAGKHKLVVGSQARILYSDQQGRIEISLAFNKAVACGQLNGPVVISRDHHDVSGTDSPYRETANIEDGSAFTADMAVQNCIGDSFRGATWVSLHNGGGVGWGEVINGGFGLVLDGTDVAAKRAKSMLAWDVSNGVARRCWSGNAYADETIRKTMESNKKLRVTLPNRVSDPNLLDRALENYE